MDNDGTFSVAEAINDPKRIAALNATDLLDSPPEGAFDRLTRLASDILNAPVSLVSLVDKDRQFFKSQIGLPEPCATARETPLSHSFCQYVVGNHLPLIVADAREHPVLRHNLALRDLKVVAYLGIPLTTADGQTLGSFCAIDGKARQWSAREIKILQELAALVMVEIELRMFAKQYQTNYLELRRVEMQREELVQMLVHDLRNPLTSLLFGLDFVANAAALDPELRDSLTLAQQGAETLLRMINEILDVSKAEAGCLKLDLTDISPKNLVAEARAGIAQLAAKAGVEVVEVASGFPTIKADCEKLRRVLVNLLSNAIQHTPNGGSVTVSTRRDETQQAIVFEVADNGCGISHEAYGKIFEKYGESTMRKMGKVSTGLGLPFCKMAVEAHGGHIAVESEVGRGTIFRFTIPVIASAKPSNSSTSVDRSPVPLEA
jgi:signal transduction histidine kinase